MAAEPFRADGSAPPLEVAARPNAHRGPRLLGWVEIALGLIWWTIAVAVTWLVADSLIGSRSLPQIADSGFWLGFASLDVAIMLAMAVGWFWLGAFHLLEAWHLKRTRLVIDHRGVSRRDGRGLTVPWEQIRHIAVTTGNRRGRRLLVDQGAVPESWWRSSSTIRPGRAYLRMLPGRRGFVVNVRLDLLDVHPDHVLGAIRHCSGGRFPDR